MKNTDKQLLKNLNLNKFMKRFLSLALAAGLVLGLQARELVTFPNAANNYQLYPENNLPDVSQAPKGYENFHIEHYGRHGSRWLIGTHRHDGVIRMLEQGDSIGGLTERGRQILEEVRQARKDLTNKEGELSPKGAMQHRGIARRMYRNFPGVFKDGAYVNARSTTIPRCILSMSNAIVELLGNEPGLKVDIDASEADHWYMKNVTDYPAIEAEKEGLKLYKKFHKANSTDGAYLAKLFNKPAEVAEVIDEELMTEYLFDIAANSVSTGEQSDIFDIFSPVELDRIWRNQNAKWYIRSGNTPLTKGLVPLRQRFLLRNFIESADSAIVSKNLSANLRYGHEVIVIPFVCLLELNDYGKVYDNLDYLAENWHSYEIFPMACNVQMVFARPKKKNYTADDVLVKVLLNERPAKLPVPAVNGDYVRWKDLRAYYAKRIGME